MNHKLPESATHTPGPWRIGCDAQGPFIVMHPTLKGVAIAACDNVFVPVNGFHSPTVDTPVSCPENVPDVLTYRPERVANVRLIAAAPDLLKELEHAHDMIRHYLKGGYLPHMSAEEAEQFVRNPDSAIRKAKGDPR